MHVLVPKCTYGRRRATRAELTLLGAVKRPERQQGRRALPHKRKILPNCSETMKQGSKTVQERAPLKRHPGGNVPQVTAVR